MTRFRPWPWPRALLGARESLAFRTCRTSPVPVPRRGRSEVACAAAVGTACRWPSVAVVFRFPAPNPALLQVRHCPGAAWLRAPRRQEGWAPASGLCVRECGLGPGGGRSRVSGAGGRLFCVGRGRKPWPPPALLTFAAPLASLKQCCRVCNFLFPAVCSSSSPAPAPSAPSASNWASCVHLLSFPRQCWVPALCQAPSVEPLSALEGASPESCPTCSHLGKPIGSPPPTAVALQTGQEVLRGCGEGPRHPPRSPPTCPKSFPAQQGAPTHPLRPTRRPGTPTKLFHAGPGSGSPWPGSGVSCGW